MPDVVGYRAKIGVILPSTNTVVEHDLYGVVDEMVSRGLIAERFAYRVPRSGTTFRSRR